MLFGTLPLSVLASAVDAAADGDDLPEVRLQSLYTYSENYYGVAISHEYRALPDSEGYFYFDISLSKAPEVDSEFIVHYRTVDDSAIAKWGDYESVGNLEDAYVTLNKSNGYKARVIVESNVLDEAFYTSVDYHINNTVQAKDKLISRRFIFELTSVEGDATLNSQSLYCYLRANEYLFQQNDAQIKSSFKSLYDYVWSLQVHNNQYKSYFQQMQSSKALYEKTIKYFTSFYEAPWQSRPTTPHIQYKGKHEDAFNISFSDEMRGFVENGLADLGISINGRLLRDYWDSDGPATFNLYYTYKGEKKLALTLNLEGEFDESTYFGWEHAFEYLLEDREDERYLDHDMFEYNNRKDFVNDNFNGFIVYDNDGNVAYKVEADRENDESVDELDLYGQLKTVIVSGDVVKYAHNRISDDYGDPWNQNNDWFYYYLRLPSNFILADSYSYEFISDSTDVDEIRWLEDVRVLFALIQNGQPKILVDENGDQMVTTNLDAIKEGDKLRMSIRFDRPVHIADPNDLCHITVDIYSDRACIAEGVRLNLKQLDGVNRSGTYFNYAWDTLVFEGELPDSVKNGKIYSIRNIRLDDGADAQTNPTEGIRSYLTNESLLSKRIYDIYDLNKDLRVPVATLGVGATDTWTKAKSVDIYVNVQGNSTVRFNDYVTVYYQWSNSTNTPETYSSKVIFNTNEDGEVLKTIIGTGDGATYLHLKAVSSYGRSSVSGPFGPFNFDNSPPSLLVDDITINDNLKERTISVSLPDDGGGSGLDDIRLYYIKKNGEEELLASFTADDFDNDSQTLTHTISHGDVGVGIGTDGNVILARDKVDFYWVLTDKLGNSSGKTAEFSLVFDTNDYISEEVMFAAGPLDLKANEQFMTNIDVVRDRTYIYDYKDDSGNTVAVSKEGKQIYYSFGFEIDGRKLLNDKKEYYDILISYNGVPLASNAYSVIYDTVVSTVTEGEISWRVKVWLHQEIVSGRYDIRLVRSLGAENGTNQVSQVYTVYATANENDTTDIKSKVEFGTLLSNKVFQLSSEYPYFYYKDRDGAIQKEHYNGTKQPATFSSLAKAKEYVYYKELSDIYLVKLNAATAAALGSGTAGYLLARGEVVTPQADQYWIRYKSESWTPTSGESAWVYYYYGMSPELTEASLSLNLQVALNTVANRIVGYGKTVTLTDTSLFLGSTMGDKMLDEYGMPYLAPGQIHSADELSSETMCANAWSTEVGFAADRNIYRSYDVYIGEGDNRKAFPLVGNFILPESSHFQYVKYEDFDGADTEWSYLDIESGELIFDYFTSSGVYYVREISNSGVSVFAFYIDKEAPRVSFSQTDKNGNLKEIPVDGVDVVEIRSKDLYIGSIFAEECDRLSYVAIYKASNLSLIGVYTADDLAAAPIKLGDGNYYVAVSDRSGNHYTITAKISSSDLVCQVKETTNKYIKLTCNRRNDQILIYEVYLNGELVTSSYSTEQTFDKTGFYTIYIQDIYGNEFREERSFSRIYPTVTWMYFGADGKQHVYDSDSTDTNGFFMTQVSDNQYKISTSVKTKFSFKENYEFEFVGKAPEYFENLGAETSITISAGQSFTLKVYYKNHKDSYSIYTGVVDVTPPSIDVSADVDVLKNGEYELFDSWIENGSVTMDDIYYLLSEIGSKTVITGETVSSDIIRINADDANGLSLIEVYLNGELIKKQDADGGFSQIIVNRWGNYRIVARDTLGNVSEFVFTNGRADDFDYFVDGVEGTPDFHGYLNFETVGNKHVYSKVDYGKTDFRLDLKKNADVFMSVGVSGGNTQIYGFRVSDGKIYALTYAIVLENNGSKTVQLNVTETLLDIDTDDFNINEEYLISKEGAYAVYAAVDLNKTVSIKVRAPQNSTEVVSVSARIEAPGSNTAFVAAELSAKSSNVSFKEYGVQKDADVRVNGGFTVDESLFESERIASVSLYYSKLNDLDVNKLQGKTDIYKSDNTYDDDGFYLLIVRNHYGNEKVYRIAISRSFAITSSVTFGDGYKIYYSKEYEGKLYSNNEITIDVLDDDVLIEATRNGEVYTGFLRKKDGNITYLVFKEAGSYEIKLTDSYGNPITRELEIDKSAYTVADELLVGYNEKALKRDEGYTNLKLSIDKAVYDCSGIYYLAIQHGGSLTVLYDAFAQAPVSADAQSFIDVIGSQGDGLYKVICRNRYGAVVTKDVHYRGTPTLKLERTTRSDSESQIYDLNNALTLGFWSNNTLVFSTDAKSYVFKINGKATECPRTLVFEHSGEYGSAEYDIEYIDEYGFEYSFKAYLVRKDVSVSFPTNATHVEFDGILHTKNDVSITFGENVYAFYTRNNSEAVIYRSGELLKKDGTYRFTVIDYAGNATTLTVKKDTIVEFEFYDANNSVAIQNGSVVNSSRIELRALNRDSAYIEKVLLNGVVQADFSGTKFSKDGKWEIILRDSLGNRTYFCFYIVTRAQNGFTYTTPYEYRITELWYDSGDGVKVTYMAFVNHTEFTSSFDFSENGKYSVVMTSGVTGKVCSFEFTVNTVAPAVSLVGCKEGETTINDVTITGYKVGDVVRIYRAASIGEELVEEVEITSLSTQIPTITEGGEYRIVVESEAGVQTELSFVRKHVMNTAGSIFIMVVIGLSVIALFTGLVYRNKSKTDD